MKSSLFVNCVNGWDYTYMLTASGDVGTYAVKEAPQVPFTSTLRCGLKRIMCRYVGCRARASVTHICIIPPLETLINYISKKVKTQFKKCGITDAKRLLSHAVVEYK